MVVGKQPNANRLPTTDYRLLNKPVFPYSAKSPDFLYNIEKSSMFF